MEHFQSIILLQDIFNSAEITKNGELPFQGVLKCIDSDMKNLFEPLTLVGAFPDKQKFYALDFQLTLNIPKPGDYEITWALASGGMETNYSYGFQVNER